MPPSCDDEDRALLERARAFRDSRGSPDVTAVTVSDLTRGDGVDWATAVLYDYLRARSKNARLIEAVKGAGPMRNSARATRIVIVPGAFHAQYAHTGADGGRVRELAAELGWACETVPVPSLGSMRANGESIVRFLQRGATAAQSTVIVSLSKGAADVRMALAHPAAAAAFAGVVGWVSLSGMVHGTPLVAWLRARPLRCLGVRVLLRLRGQRFAAIDELRHDGGELQAPLNIPPHVRAIHVLGFPLSRHLSNDWAHRGYQRLSPLGPNDGGGILLSDSLRLPGEVFPVWGVDHYLQPQWDLRPLLLRILSAAAGMPGAGAGAE
jgi:hypothetical protein